MAKPRNVIVFGETGAGKSSLVNMLTGRQDAKVGNDAVGVTFESQKHSAFLYGSDYQIFDTVGLNEGDKGMVKAKDAISELIRLIQSLEDGVNLLIFCMRGRIKKSTPQNYELFYKVFCDSKVPIILAVTGLEELDEGELDIWWNRNETMFKGYGMEFGGFVCGTTTKGKKGIYAKEFDATKRKICPLVNGLALKDPWTKARLTWFSGIICAATKLFPTIFGSLCWPYTTLRDALVEFGGFSVKDAEEMARAAL